MPKDDPTSTADAELRQAIIASLELTHDEHEVAAFMQLVDALLKQQTDAAYKNAIEISNNDTYWWRREDGSYDFNISKYRRDLLKLTQAPQAGKEQHHG